MPEFMVALLDDATQRRVCGFGQNCVSMPNKPNIRIITLGCAKNDVDSEEIAGVLSEAGYSVDGSRVSDVTIINTCGFLEDAKEEGLRAIAAAVQDRTEGRTGKVIVAGCLSQRLGNQIEEVAPGADLYVGVGHMAKFSELVDQLRRPSGIHRKADIGKPHHRWAKVETRTRTGAPWSAYLKVSEGCDHKCTFCTIPSFRGPHRSKPLERIVKEAQHLGATGAKEINLIAQDVTQYGYDLYRKFTMPRLLDELSTIEGIEWMRLLYCYPNRITDEVIEAIASLPKVCKYIDVPLQHAHPDILRSMKRPWDGERYLALFAKLRRRMPDIAIRTTFIVGFPGETEEHFRYLEAFVKEAQLDRVGSFIYSREEGTPSFLLDNQIPAKIKLERQARLMTTQKAVSRSVNERWIGREVTVLAEAQGESETICRSERDAPEIDGVVMVKDKLRCGEFHRVAVTGASEYDLYAETI
jgi:ribosomal protein S12 methylthiotransferase